MFWILFTCSSCICYNIFID